jgi:hypothetical protein
VSQALKKDGYTVKQELDKQDPTMTRLVLSGIQHDVDEDQFKQKYSGFVQFENVYVERKNVSEAATGIALDLVQATFVSYYSQFGPISGMIDMLPFYMSQTGKMKQTCSLYLRYKNPADTLTALNQSNGKLLSEVIKLRGISYGYVRLCPLRAAGYGLWLRAAMATAKVQYSEEYHVPSKVIALFQADIKQLEAILASEFKCRLKVA